MQTKKNNVAFQQENQIDIDSIIKDVLRQWWVILLIAISAAFLAGTYKRLTYSPVYETSTTFAVGKSGFSNNLAYDNLSSAESVTTKFTQIANSSVLKKRVCEELDIPSFDAQVSIQIVESSNLMTLTVTSSSPDLAYKIIHSVMDITMELGSELMDTVAVKVLQPPIVPQSPKVALNIKSVMKKASLVAAVCMVAVFVLLSYFKDTVKNAEEAKKKIDAKLLGTINHENKQRGFKEFFKKNRRGLSIENTMVSLAYAESVKRVATRVRSAMDRKQSRVLLVTSVSENEGKSTVAANIALALAQEDKKVALVDCDFRKPSQYKLFEIDNKESEDFTEYLTGKQSMVIKQVGEMEKVNLLCSMSSKQHFLSCAVMEKLEKTLKLLMEKVDYIIIDTSPMALVSDGEDIASMADSSLLVVQQDMMEAKYINDTIDQLNRTKAKVLGCVLNNVHRGIFNRTRERGYYGSKYNYQSRYGKKERQSDKQE